MTGRTTLYVIESRDSEGRLLFRDTDGKRLPMPEEVFGNAAITGITEDAMAKAIFAKAPEAILDGRFVAQWPTILNPNWKARVKTW